MIHTIEAWAVRLTREGHWGIGFYGIYQTRKAARVAAKEPQADGWTVVGVVKVRLSIEVIE